MVFIFFEFLKSQKKMKTVLYKTCSVTLGVFCNALLCVFDKARVDCLSVGAP